MGLRYDIEVCERVNPNGQINAPEYHVRPHQIAGSGTLLRTPGKEIPGTLAEIAQVIWEHAGLDNTVIVACPEKISGSYNVEIGNILHYGEGGGNYFRTLASDEFRGLVQEIAFRRAELANPPEFEITGR